MEKFAAKSVPNVNFRQVITSFTGVRSSEKSGDFIIEASKKVPGLVHCGAYDSPGLTCCVATAKMLVNILQEQGLHLDAKENWNGHRDDPHAFAHMTDEEKNELIAREPAFGKIVCRCEEITEGEILLALRMNPVALDMDGVKRRTRSGMGRCQGGFCGPYVMQLIAKEREIPKENVTKFGGESRMVLGKAGEV